MGLHFYSASFESSFFKNNFSKLTSVQSSLSNLENIYFVGLVSLIFNISYQVCNLGPTMVIGYLHW